MQKFKIENIFKPRVTTVDLKIPYSFKFKNIPLSSFFKNLFYNFVERKIFSFEMDVEDCIFMYSCTYDPALNLKLSPSKTAGFKEKSEIICVSTTIHTPD